MTDPTPTPDAPRDEDAGADDFAAMAETETPGLVREFIDFLSTNKKWWLTPILVVLLLVGLLVLIGSTGAAPFIYTLF